MNTASKRLFFASIHAEDIFPWTDPQRVLPTGVPGDMIHNCALSNNSDSARWQARTLNILNAMTRFQPDLVLVSAGFDAHGSDTFGSGKLNLECQDYKWVGSELRRRFPRVISVLEGGYKIDVLSECCAAHIQGLHGH